MLDLVVKVHGLKEAIGDLRKISKAARAGMYAGANDAALFVKNRVIEFIANEGEGSWHAHALATDTRWGRHKIMNLTGDLISSVEVVPFGLTPSIVINAPHAVFHEMGTKEMPARPILSPVGMETREEVARIIKDSILKYVDALGLPASRVANIKQLLTLAAGGKGLFGRASAKPQVFGKILGMRERFLAPQPSQKDIFGKSMRRVWPERIQRLHE